MEDRKALLNKIMHVHHFHETFQIGNADAALAASVFHFQEIEIPVLKQTLKNNNIHIRL